MSDISGVSCSSTASLLAQLRQQYLARLQSGAGQNGVNAANQSSTVSGQTDSDGDSDQSPAAVSGSTDPATTSGSSSTPLSSGVLTVLILTQEQAGGADPSQGPAPGGFDQQFTSALDSNSNSDGTITESELEKAVSAVGGTTQQADALFNQLDTNGSASIDTSAVVSALNQSQRGHGHHGGHHHDADAASGNSASNSGSDPLSALLQNASTTEGTGTTVTNPDGSTTTTLAYADGTTVTLTTPATNASFASGSASSQPTAGTDGSGAPQPNPETLLTTLIRLQEQAFQPVTPAASQAAA